MVEIVSIYVLGRDELCDKNINYKNAVQGPAKQKNDFRLVLRSQKFSCSLRPWCSKNTRS